MPSSTRRRTSAAETTSPRSQACSSRRYRTGTPPRPPRPRPDKRGQASPGLPDRLRAPAGRPSGSGPEVVSSRTQG
eukprot:3409822-Alexandrium_andersonii.AAC.1